MKFHLPTLKHLVIQLAKLQIYTLNLTATFWHCKKNPITFEQECTPAKMACIVRCKMPAKIVIRENGKQCMRQKPVKNNITTIPIYCDASRLLIQGHVNSTHIMTGLNVMGRYKPSLMYGLIFLSVRETITELQHSCLAIVKLLK